jgi:hypothetical protein
MELSDLQQFLFESCLKNEDLLGLIVSNYIDFLDDEGKNELEDLLVNNFGDL